MNTSKLIFLSLLAICLFSCHTEEANVYSIKGFIGNDPLIFSLDIENGTVGLYEGDQLIATSEIENGLFSFEHLSENKTYTVIPNLLSGSRNGISSLDIAKITNYIAGTMELSAIEKISADVNKDGLINEEDIDQIRNCIVLGSDCPGWRYYTSDYDGLGNGSLDQATIIHIFKDHEITFRVAKLGDINCTLCTG